LVERSGDMTGLFCRRLDLVEISWNEGSELVKAFHLGILKIIIIKYRG